MNMTIGMLLDKFKDKPTKYWMPHIQMSIAVDYTVYAAFPVQKMDY